MTATPKRKKRRREKGVLLSLFSFSIS